MLNEKTKLITANDIECISKKYFLRVSFFLKSLRPEKIWDTSGYPMTHAWIKEAKKLIFMISYIIILINNQLSRNQKM